MYSMAKKTGYEDREICVILVKSEKDMRPENVVRESFIDVRKKLKTNSIFSHEIMVYDVLLCVIRWPKMRQEGHGVAGAGDFVLFLFFCYLIICCRNTNKGNLESSAMV